MANCARRSVRGWTVGALIGATLGAATGRRHGLFVSAVLGAAAGAVIGGGIWDAYLEHTDPTCCTYDDYGDDRCMTRAEREAERERS